ncbi:hypothetical protein PHISP_02708 [Aspergillus sp. HF37]|nr:hypothetical protein PHISP_02708 [Aspergillus sp. HF37]
MVNYRRSPPRRPKNPLASLLQTAALHPLDSPEQSALLTLLHGLKSVSDTDGLANSSNPCTPPTTTTISLPLLNETARALFFDRPRGWHAAAQWTNLNAFLARATKDGLLVPGLQDLGIANAREALEMRQEPEERLDVLLAGAGVWMVVMGEEIWGFLREGEGAEDKRGGGNVWERWQFWKRRFLFMSHREDLSVASRELAAEAEAVMGRVA